SHPAQRGAGDRRGCDPARRLRHPRRGGAVVSWRRGAASNRQLGKHGGGRARVLVSRVVGQLLFRAVHLSHRHDLQSGWRRAPRCIRSTAACHGGWAEEDVTMREWLRLGAGLLLPLAALVVPGAASAAEKVAVVAVGTTFINLNPLTHIVSTMRV